MMSPSWAKSFSNEPWQELADSARQVQADRFQIGRNRWSVCAGPICGDPAAVY